MTTIPTPDKAFRDSLDDSLAINIEAEVRDYLNRIWLNNPDSFDVDDVMQSFMDYIDIHFAMVWIRTKD